MQTEDRIPVLVGVAQLTRREADPAEAAGPVEMMTEVARAAAEDTGAPQILESLDTVAVVNVLSGQYTNAPRLLAERLGARPRREVYTHIGGDSPQALVNDTADRIAAGEVRMALLAGAEALATLRRAGRAGVSPRWAFGGAGEPERFGDPRPGNSPYEANHGLQLPTQIYPLFENAVRAHGGRGIQKHQHQLGELCAAMSAVAAENPNAWFRTARTADEIATPSPENRMVAFPYTKYMNAIIEVDQAAAVLMTSVATARARGIPESRWIYPLAGARAHDHWLVSERADYHTSPAIRIACQRALAAAGRTVDDLEVLDLYSCFPVAVEIARDMLGIAPDDPRPLTATGGLPYHGGPGNNYSMHAIATVVEGLRARPHATGLVTALGWYMTKHAVGLYAAAPPAQGWQSIDSRELQAEIDAIPRPPLVEQPDGAGTVETYTVLFDRDSIPLRGVVIGRLAGGERFLANADDRSLLDTWTRREAVGTKVDVRHRDGTNHVA